MIEKLQYHIMVTYFHPPIRKYLKVKNIILFVDSDFDLDAAIKTLDL